MEIKKVIVIGASAGGIKATVTLLEKIPKDLPIALFVVIHLAKISMPEIILQQLQKATTYKCRIPGNEEPIEAGYLYLAPADKHLLIDKTTVRIIMGAHENRWRPSVDVLFRSAAASYDSRVIGIVLSGMMDDGTSGMSAIERCGGTCIVQEPQEAEYANMPQSVLNNVREAHQVLVADMGYIIDDAIARPPHHLPIPPDVKLEAEITARMISSIPEMNQLGEHSDLSCPDCGGRLWKMNNEPLPRYRCHTGHVYAESLLLQKQSEALEESIWVSIRMMEERRNMLLNMHASENRINTDVASRAQELAVHIERLKDLLTSLGKISDDEGYL
jgi:two-component system chemotaxis response regulator CheB